MLAILRLSAVAILLAMPTAIAFFSGGYFAGARLIAGIGVWLIVALSVWLVGNPLPKRRPGRAALAGLLALTILVGLSILWAPLRSAAQSDLQRLLLYLGMLIAAIALLRGRFGLRLTEAALACGALLVTLYALAARLLPGLVSEAASQSAAGRLEQPLTYWNASGMLAAIGFILALRIAGDATRARWQQSLGIAAAVPLGLGVYLTFSRGALLAVAVGVILLIAVTRQSRQLRVVLVGLGGGIAVSAVAAFLPSFRALAGSAASREQQGLVMVVVLALVVCVVVVVGRSWGELAGEKQLSAPRALAAGLTAVLLVAFIAVAAGDGSSNGQPRFGADTRRLTSFESNRYSYWNVAGGMFVDAPLAGESSSSFRVVWRQERTILDPALDAHSLYIETAAELGLLGLLALALLIGGVAWAGRNVHRADRAAAAGALATLGAFAVHAGLDWDWEMPALSLIALLMAGAVIAADEQLAAPVSRS